jgi:hypothetical protein
LWLIRQRFSPQPNFAFNRDADTPHRFAVAKRAPVNLALGFPLCTFDSLKEGCMKSLKYLTLVSMLAACTTTTGVIPIGKDTYMVSGTGKSPGGYSGSEVKVAAFKEAMQFCATQSKQMQVVRTEQRDMSFGVNATAELQFMCLDAGDPELGRPKFKKDADQIIEVKNSITQPAATKDVYAELIKLDDLRKRGIISDAEFEAQKKALLAIK